MTHFGNYNPLSFGWDVPDASDIVPFEYNGVSFPAGVNKLAVPQFTVLVDRLLTRGLIPGGLKTPGCWGYFYRDIRGGESLSFHAFGLALDINAPENPSVSSAAKHSISDQAGEVARELGFEWGGDWTSPIDYMHFELHMAPEEIRAPATDDWFDMATIDDLNKAAKAGQLDDFFNRMWAIGNKRSADGNNQAINDAVSENVITTFGNKAAGNDGGLNRTTSWLVDNVRKAIGK